MKNLVVTSGKKYIDIDAYAGCIVYSILLNSLGKSAKTMTTAKYNESIPQAINDLNFSFDNYEPTINDKFIILDVSNPEMFDDKVDKNRIVEIIDHHTGFEEYWLGKGINSNIEFIGSICTIIFEKFEKENKLNLLNSNLCKLLIAAILDNTLNLKAGVTNERDINAYHKLLKIGNINEDWINEYFLSCQKAIENDLENAIINDLKIEYVSDILPKVFGQLLVFNKDSIINRLEEIKELLRTYDENWILNLISLSDGKSYIVAENNNTKKRLESFFNNKFENDILILDKFMLRKEIMKKARQL